MSSESQHSQVAIEAPGRISDSQLWKLQRQFYVEKGIDLWRTRSAFNGAKSYFVETCAEIVASYLLDCLPLVDYDKPVFLIELGTGSGCFSYRFLKALRRRVFDVPELSRLKIRYVMTDIIEPILEIWKNNAFLSPFIASGNLDFDLGLDLDFSLDFACFDPGQGPEIVTAISGEVLNAGAFANAPIFIANALFDTIAQDGFQVCSGKLHEITGQLFIPAEMTAMNALIEAKVLLEQETGSEVAFPYYGDAHFDQAVHEIGERAGSGALSFPTGALRILRNLRRLSNDRFVVFAYSRGFVEIEIARDWKQLPYRDLSFPLNFAALESYLLACGGELLKDAQGSVELRPVLGLFLPAEERQRLNALRMTFSSLVRHDRLNTLRQIEDAVLAQPEVSPLESMVPSLIAYLRLLDCDPEFFASLVLKLFDQLEPLVPALAPGDAAGLRKVLGVVYENIYAFDREVSPLKPDLDLMSLLVAVWQRAREASPTQMSRAFF